MKNLTRSGFNFKSLLFTNKQSLYIHEYQAYDLLKKYQLPLVPVTPQIIFRVLEQVHLKMLMLLPKELCQV